MTIAAGAPAAFASDWLGNEMEQHTMGALKVMSNSVHRSFDFGEPKRNKELSVAVLCNMRPAFRVNGKLVMGCSIASLRNWLRNLSSPAWYNVPAEYRIEHRMINLGFFIGDGVVDQRNTPCRVVYKALS